MAFDELDRISQYMQWYWRHTRRWIQRISSDTGRASDIAEELYRLSINSRSTCPSCVDYRDRVAHDQRNILLALREQRFNVNPQPAPPTIELPRPQIPRDRPSKRRGGYLSTQPIIENENAREQEPPIFTQASDISLSPSSPFISIDPTQLESHYMAPSSSSPSNSANPSQFQPFMTLLDNPALFSAEYNASTFEHGGPSNEAFVTPRQSIHLNESPWFDLNTPTTQTNETFEAQEIDIQQQRPQRMRRRPRCGTGSHYQNESEDIKNIVEHVCEILDKKDLFVANHPVGVNSRVQDSIKMSKSHPPNDVLLLGIWGMGGIGKTVIAKAIYNEIGGNFESRSFLSNIREVWEQDHGPVYLQQQLLSQICKTTKMIIPCIESGKNMLKERLRQKQALVVLDDVDKVEQLNALSGSVKWFGPGSRIIIITRDEHLLRCLNVDVDHVYRVKNMDENESIELFSWHAFRQPSPGEGFVELSRNIVAYSGGLPLALEILGCYLFDRELTEWKSVLDKLKKIPNGHIQKKLKISFDGLNDDTEREIFLDISCFFIGMDRNDVTQILNASGFFADIGISVLVERSLVTIDEKNKLGMHDLLRDMGREIIREKSPKEFGKHSRLWFHKDVIDVLSKHIGTESVEGLALNLSQDGKVYFLTKAFKKMKALRLLRLANVELDGDYKYISRDLKWLCWHKFPLKYIPANFLQNNLVAIELKYSSLRLWREPQLLENLKILNLSHSPYLVSTPDFSKLPNLEKLILKDCPSLATIHNTIGHLDKIHLINLKDCTGLRSVPRSIYKLKCLKTLILSGCLMIEKLEEDIEQMDSLSTVIADDIAITKVPISLASRHDAFVSFRGDDTRASFTSHLFSALTNAGIVAFKDDTDVLRGKRISTELLFGIERSTIFIIIFSKDYAGSRWCLIELSEIMELHRAQGRVVLPVFYGVDPSEVQNQVSSFGKAFRDLIHKISPIEDEVSRWRTDLREAGGITGFVVLNSK
ncbi:TMV resistance protein N-like [Neltuma alba]|uniref:TMV resistance protein N-like n=1 Tax=Neltuma alba TaxID=207710 RepID=UPI0010A5A15E|nr:TMV resistance protein N-like [Prosopis alba]